MPALTKEAVQEQYALAKSKLLPIAFSTSPDITKAQKQAARDALDDIDDDFILAAVDDIHGRTRQFQEFIDFMEKVLLDLSQVGLLPALNEVQGVLDHSKALLQAANQ